MIQIIINIWLLSNPKATLFADRWISSSLWKRDLENTKELFVNPDNFYMRKPHLYIGIIGHCSTLSGSLVSGLVTAAAAKAFPDQKVTVDWLESDQARTLEHLFEQEKVRDIMELKIGKHFLPSHTFPIMQDDKKPLTKSDFDFIQPRRHSGFDLKSSRIRSKHRPRARPY